MKKLLCAFLAVLMVVSLFLVSCTKEEEKTTQGGGEQQSQTTAEDTSDKFTAEVKKLNRTFTIIRRNSSSAHLTMNEIWAEAVSGDKVNDAVFSRNSQLQERFGITVQEIPDGNPATTYREALIAGEYVGDLIAYTLNGTRPLANSNLLVDWSSLENIDLGKIWWNHNLTEKVTISGKSFFITGDALTLDDRATWILYYNIDLVNNAGLESIYTLVDNGTWTTDKMYEYMQKASIDSNGDGVFTYGTDTIGYSGERFNNWVHVAAGNVTVSSRSADGAIVIPEQPKQELLDAWSKVRPVMTSPLRYVASASGAFRKGTIVFYGCNLGTLLNFPNATMNFGIIPYPKHSVEQEGYYTSASHAQLGILAIPTTVEADPAKDWTANGFASAAEQVAYMTEAYAYLSMNTLTPAFYDQVLMKQSVQDPQSAKNLQMTLDTDYIVLDPVVLFNFGKLGHSLFYDGNPSASVMADELAWDNFVANYSSRVAAAKEALLEYETITSTPA